MPQQTKLLSLNQWSVAFSEAAEDLALNKVSFSLEKGTSMALLGASGSGKSLISLSIMGLLPKNAQTQGSITFQDMDLNTSSNWEKIRGQQMAMIFQEPMSALNPLMSCGQQLLECIQTHQTHLSTKAAKEETLYWLNQVKLPQVEQLFHKYPHELSGGQKQRVMIAMALCNKPQLIIADEPTTALDVLVQKEILDLLKVLQQEHHCALLFITHDMGVARYIADKVVIIDKGKVIGNDIAIDTPSLVSQEIEEQSTQQPTLPILEIKDLSVVFTTKTNIWGKPTDQFTAVNHISFTIDEGSTLGLVGGSGCGKSTVSKCIMGIEPIHSGTIRFKGKDYRDLTKKDWLEQRKMMQMIFQDPHASLSPKVTVQDMLAEVLKVHHLKTNKQEKQQFIHHLLDKVGLPQNALHKYPHEFSGGQKQRICIARALAVQPMFLICDESIAALDNKMQYQILQLLKDIQISDKLTYLFITHDLRVAESFCDSILVMKEGRIVEEGNAKTILTQPQDAYTLLLKNAML